MEFGITFKGVVKPNRARALVRQAENGGFDYCWYYDSHILWRESFVAMAMLMEHTSKIRFGPLVTNPNTRDWSAAASLFGSLAIQSDGRFDIGLGRGDSAVRVMAGGSGHCSGQGRWARHVKLPCDGGRPRLDRTQIRRHRRHALVSGDGWQPRG
jgi:alkanesulfonate monooxygenase SsuD/methylene tetrahydromethanopterin reductase-like flavin-dependent oxidoreductase (luciferase family)